MIHIHGKAPLITLEAQSQQAASGRNAVLAMRLHACKKINGMPSQFSSTGQCLTGRVPVPSPDIVRLAEYDFSSQCAMHVLKDELAFHVCRVCLLTLTLPCC